MRFSRLLAMIALAALVTPVSTAVAHDTGQAVDPDETEPVERASGNMELVAHHYFAEGSDIMFQRREGPQVLDGEVVDDVRDYAFVGGDAKNATDYGAMEIFDVTDPTLPDHIAHIPCSGYHAEVGAYENLMFQGIDSSGTNQGCEQPEVHDPLGVDEPGKEGIRIFDVTDPANPTVLDFLDARDRVPGVHNFTVDADAGLLYLSGIGGSGQLGIVDLESRDEDGNHTFEVTTLDFARDIGVPADQVVADCHDIGLNPEHDLMACAAGISGQTYIWDTTDPRQPTHISTIFAPEIVQHGARWAPDGTTLVLNDEFAGALDRNVDDDSDIGVGSNGCLGPNGAIGALWFYDTTDPANPVPMGSFTPQWPEPTASPCTSHFYNFIPGTTKVVVGWYEGGIVVADYGSAPVITQDAVFLPEYGNFWAAYAYRGYIYGASRTIASKGFGGGLWVVSLEGMEDLPPAAPDEGTSWVRWNSALPGPIAMTAVTRADGWARAATMR